MLAGWVDQNGCSSQGLVDLPDRRGYIIDRVRRASLLADDAIVWSVETARRGAGFEPATFGL
jgi:hypothetical protein